MDEEDVERAVARGIEEGITNVAVTAGSVYVLGGCFLVLLKLAGFVLLAVAVLVAMKC